MEDDFRKIEEIGPGAEIQIGDFTVRAYHSRHCRFDLPLLLRTVFCKRFWRHPAHTARLLWLDMTYPEKKEILFYEVRCDGVRLQIMGSMNLDPKEAYETGADALILPLQGRSDQDEYAVRLAKRLRPKRIFLDHYDNAFPPLTGDVDTSGFIRNVQHRLGIRCQAMEEGSTVELGGK